MRVATFAFVALVAPSLFAQALRPRVHEFRGSAHYRRVGSVAENDLAATPGDVRTTSKRVICSTRTGKIRNVPDSLKTKVFLTYSIHCGDKCGKLYEIDHLISLEIGGTNDFRNLWPEPYKSPGAHQKDILENKLHKMICEGSITPAGAQKAISLDWYKAYRKYVYKADGGLSR